MSRFKNISVEITTFINPHLFWIILTKDVKERDELVENLQSLIVNPRIIRNVEKGEIVLVYDNVWKRAYVKEANKFRYTCWLKDYGVFYNCEKIYEIPEECKLQTTFIKQAALNGIVNVQQQFRVNTIEKTHTKKFCPGVIKCAKDQITDARIVFFECLNENDGIHKGRLQILSSDGHIYHLADSLAEDGMVAFDKELFPEALKENLDVEESRFLSFLRLSSPCSNQNNASNAIKEIVEDISESKGIGRGTVRSTRLKEAEISPGKKTLVEDWLRDSTKESIDQSDFCDSTTTSQNTSSDLLKSPENNSTVTVSSTPKVPKDCFSRLKQTSMKRRSLEEANKSSPSSANSSINTPKQPIRRSSEFSPLECLRSYPINKYESNSTKSNISSITSDSNVSEESNSSSMIKNKTSSNEILQSLVKGLETSSLITDDKSDIEDTESINKSYFSMLEKKFDSKFKVSPKKAKDVDEVASVKSAPQSKWGEYFECNKSQKRLDILPAGMLQQEPKKKRSVSFHPSAAGSSFSDLQKKEPGGTQYSKPMPNSSFQKQNEYPREFGNTCENIKSGMELLKQNCTQGCLCPQCQIWDSDTLDNDDKDFADTESKPQKIICKPSLLLKIDNKEEVIEIQSPDTTKATDTERSVAPKVVIHGNTLPYSATSVNSIPFHAYIHRVLRSFEQVYTVQSYSWVVTMRQSNMCIVNGPKTGKTMGYLPSICSFLLEAEDEYDMLPKNTISPIVIILCPGSDVAHNVQDLYCKLMNQFPNKPTCAFAVPPIDKKCLNQFQGQNDLLITTPLTLISLIRTRIITVKRVCHLIIENGDKILNKFHKEMDNILMLMQSMLQHRTCYHGIQMIVTAEHWTSNLENLMKRLNVFPTICIGSYLEAALYGRVDIQMHFLNSNNKRKTLAELLEDSSSVCKTVVICNTDAEIEEAGKYLNLKGINTLSINSTTNAQAICDMEKQWNATIGGKHLTLLCNDQVYNSSINISEAVLLVHYSLPDSWTQFANRFRCLINNYISPFAVNVPSDWVRCKVHIFVDESCTKQFPKLVQLLQRMGAKLSPEFISVYTESIKAREEIKLASKITLCPNLKLFGKCSSDNRQLYEMSTQSEIAYSSLNCKNRHILSLENDYSSNLPKCGIIKFKIMRIQDVTTFTVKILEHTDSEGTASKWGETYENLEEELQKALSAQAISVFDVKLDQLYVWYSEKYKKYHRCTIQRILEIEQITKLATSVRIRCLDSGIKRDVNCSSLYELPKKFRNIPAQGIDIIIANTIPPDLDDCWGSHCKSKVKYILNEANYENKEVYGISQILLQLDNVIWVKNIHFREKLKTINTIVTKLNLRKSLKDQNLVNYSEEPLENLYSLCKNAGIDLPDYNKLPSVGKGLENKSRQVEPQWAYLEDCDCNEIYISCLFTPSLFYVRLKKFYELFEILQNDIQEAIAKPFYPKECEVEVGKYYLAKDFGGDDYCRVKVTEINENIAKCYYVDFGDCASINVADIKHLTDQLIVKLPFQAIECRLYGVEPAWSGEGWEETAINLVNDYIFEPKTDYYRTLYTTVCKQEPATSTGGQRCAILLIDNFKQNKIVLLNQLLIDCGEAINVEGEDLDQQFNLPEPYEEPNDALDIDDEIKDKDLTIEDVARLSAKFKTDDNINNNNQTSQIENSNDTSGSEPSWDIVIDDPETFMKQLIGVKVDVPANTSSERELPPMKALKFSKHSTPNIEWFQTTEIISINIMLPDLKDYVLKVIRNRMIMFKTMYEEKEYCLELQLFDKVLKAFKYKVYGQYLTVILTKCTAVEWPRLIVSANRMRHIKYDVSRIVVPEDEKKTFLKFSSEDEDGKNDDDKNEDYLIDIGSDEDYSESDVESFHSD